MSQIFGPKGGGTPAPGTVLFLEGNTGGQVGPDITGTIFIVGSGDVNVAGSPLSDTLTISITPGSFIQTVDGNTGHASGSTITLTTGASNAQGTALVTGDNVNTLTLTFTDSNTNTGLGTGVFSNPGFVGSDNTALGRRAGFSVTSANSNTLIGSDAGIALSTGGNNTIVGQFGAFGLTTGTSNTILGISAGSSYGGAESGNILINDSGINGESNTLHIGGSPALTSAYIGGIFGVTPLVPSPLSVVIDSSGQLGTSVLSPITTIDGNTGSASGATITLTTGAGNVDGTALFTGDGVSTITQTFTDPSSNVGLGSESLSNLTGGSQNTALGALSAVSISTGTDNVAVGYFSLANALTGSRNVALGLNAGSNFTGAESDNIDINNNGVLGESNTLRIGSGTGTGSQQLKAAFISGIDGVSVGSVASVVSINSSNQLGTTTITAGNGITLSVGTNAIIITAVPNIYEFTAVSTTPYVVLSTDQYLSVTSSSLAITIELPNAPTQGRIFTVKDSTGTSATHNITVTTVGGAVTIDGATTFVMNTNYEAINLLFNGTSYEVF